MLVLLPYGVCVNPEIVKMVLVRPDRSANKPVFTVVMKTDDEGYQVIATFDERTEAEALSVECAKRINKGMGEGGDEDEDASDDDDLSDDEDADDDAPADEGAAADDDDDW